MNIACKMTGSHSDMSGYASANRAETAALYIAGVDVTIEIVVQQRDRSSNGWEGELSRNLENRDIPYKVKIIHLTPDMYPRYTEPGVYHIGRLMWETDKLPDLWIDPINKMGEIWTTSANMAEVFKKSGVKVPIYWFPQPINISEADVDFGEFDIKPHKGFLFYSIFQWIERKNPRALLTAYWEAFSGHEDVSLLIKTHKVNFDEAEFDDIKEDIMTWKKQLGLRHYPKILLCKKLLTHNEMMKMHQTGDCYVQPDRGEGWSRTIQEALLMGKTVVSTARGGIHEYLQDEHYFRVPSLYVPVTEQNWIPWYTKDQNWAEVDKEQLKKVMLFVFRNQQIAQAKGMVAKNYIKDKFSYHKIGDQMKQRLEVIYRGL